MEKPEEIYLKVLEMYKKYGVKSVTMDDVSRELGISKKTLYTLVKDKKELLDSVVEYEFEVVKKCFNEVFDKEGINAIEQLFEVNYFMRNLLKYYSPSFDYDLRKYYPDLFRKINERKYHEMYDSVLINMKKGKSEGIYRKDLNEELIAKLYVTRIMHAHESAIISIEDFIAPDAYKEYFVYHIRGIANDKGIKILEKNLDKLEHTENE
jgi:AcrR family transcriptional regulator